MANYERYMRVQALLEPCSKNHRKDEDWYANDAKQVCPCCSRALCEHCGIKVRGTFGGAPFKLYCDQHAKEQS